MAGEGVATRRGGRRDGDISGSDQGSRAGSVASQDDAIERLRAEAEQQRVAMEQQQLQHAKDVQELKAQLVAMAARPASTEVASGAEAARETSPPPPSSVSVVLGSLFAGRTDTTVHLRAEDFGVTADFLWLRLTEKGKRGLALRRVIRLPIDAELVSLHLELQDVRSVLTLRCLARFETLFPQVAEDHFGQFEEIT